MSEGQESDWFKNGALITTRPRGKCICIVKNKSCDCRHCTGADTTCDCECSCDCEHPACNCGNMCGFGADCECGDQCSAHFDAGGLYKHNAYLNSGYDRSHTKTGSESKRKDGNMATDRKTKVFKAVKGDMQRAAWRTSAKQLTAAVKAPLIGVVGRMGLDASKVAMIEAFMSTPVGRAIVAGILGAAIGPLSELTPGGEASNAVGKLSEELRTLAATEALDSLVSLGTTPILGEIQKAISAGVAAEKALESGTSSAPQLETPVVHAEPVKTRVRARATRTTRGAKKSNSAEIKVTAAEPG